MSYTIEQAPVGWSLSSNIKDIIITSDADIVFGLKNYDDQDNYIIIESYTPDSESKIYITDLEKVVNSYISGSGLDVITQTSLFLMFEIWIDGAPNSAFLVLKCNAYTSVSAENFALGNVFLHLMKQKKMVTPTSKEYVTVSFTADNSRKVQVFITTRTPTGYVNSDPIDFITSETDAIKTLDVSFPAIVAKYPAVNPDDIIAYRLSLPKEISVFLVDRNSYLLPLEFRFKNSFDVPETLMSRGTANRKGKTSFDTSTVRSVVTKYNVVRNDEFEVTSGKIFSLNDYDRYREMFNSEVVEINFQGKWRKIIITEENSNVGLRMGSLQPISFTFMFADKVDNNVITGESFMRWILEYGKWTDENMWLDPEHWTDS